MPLEDPNAGPDEHPPKHVPLAPGADAAPAIPVAAPVGAYRVWLADDGGALIDPPGDDGAQPHQNPGKPEAVDIVFVVEAPPPKEQAALQGEIDKVLGVVQRLYLRGAVRNPERFRIYYVRLFHIAQLGLQGNAQPDIAAAALAVVTADLLDDEAGRVKNAHLRALGVHALKFSLPFALLYLIIGLSPNGFFVAGLRDLAIDPPTLAAFALLWIGCFTGVWLAYGIRKAKVSLADLVTTDEDRLDPQIRLIFAGLLTMLLGILFTLGVFELKIGTVELTDIAARPMLAYLVGTLCGISELALPASVGNRAGALMSGLR